jgi:hypothetical protein
MIQMYVNTKIIPVETVPRFGGGGMKEMEGWIQVCYIWYIAGTFVNAPMHPHPAKQ